MDVDFSSTALVISRAGMGAGDTELTERLLGNYLNTLVELGSAPAAVLMYAEGVHAACREGAARTALHALRAAGTRIIVCRTCLAHYGLLESLPEEEIGNMLAIIEAQAQAGRVISL